MKTIALYPGTFDPITNGHIDLIHRANKLFSKVIVGIAQSTAKNPLFSLEERIEMAESVLGGSENIQVLGFKTLMVDFANSVNASVIIRGLRAVSDFEYEVQLAGMNRSMQPDIETVYLSPDIRYTFLSSTLIKDIARHGGDVKAFTHPVVDKALQTKFSC